MQAFALADGRAAAFKIEDGSARAREPVTVALLRRLGVTTGPGVPDSALDAIGAVPVLGGGRVVGVIRAVASPGSRAPVSGGACWAFAKASTV